MINLKDTATLVEIVFDGYGDEKIERLSEIDCLFLQSTSSRHAANVDVIQSDAHVYLDVNNPVLLERGYRIEGMHLIINPFGASDDDSWYKITRVMIGQRKLLDNDVDNVHAYLKKVARVEE